MKREELVQMARTKGLKHTIKFIWDQSWYNKADMMAVINDKGVK